MAEVLPLLLLGDLAAAESCDALNAAGVRRVVDLSNLFPSPRAPRLEELTEGLPPPLTSKLLVRLNDQTGEEVGWAIEACSEYIHASRARGEPVLVHCFEVSPRERRCRCGLTHGGLERRASLDPPRS